jgi:hypothetical protein
VGSGDDDDDHSLPVINIIIINDSGYTLVLCSALAGAPRIRREV